MNIAIIPARSGSKRLKNKNIILFNKKPMISHILNKLKKSNIFNRIIVSTDSIKIASIANLYGAETPFIRPPKLSDDKATSIAVAKHAIKFLIKKNKKINNVCMVYATAPHTKIKNLKLGLKLIKNKKTKFIFPASEIKKRNKNGFFVNDNLNLINKATKLSAKHLDSGQFYWGRVNTWLKNKSVFIKNSKIIKIPHSENIDLNTKNDLMKLKKFCKIK